MKKYIILLVFIIGVIEAQAQSGYPEPKPDANRLFYIQHSNNHNTFVYDANFSAPKKLNATDPIHIYRITYTNGGIKEELSNIQRRLAYGITITKAGSNTFDFSLVAYPAKTLALKLHANGKPYVTVEVNGKHMVLRKMFLSVNKTGTKVFYIDFYGTNSTTGKEVMEHFVIEK